MNTILLLTATITLSFTGLASDKTYATGIHKSADAHAPKVTIGEPGRIDGATRTISVTMKETIRGDMVFEPSSIDVRRSEIVRFTITNNGLLDHEFVMDTQDNVIGHKASMEEFPQMIHE